jgi:hypothetical protein
MKPIHDQPIIAKQHLFHRLLIDVEVEAIEPHDDKLHLLQLTMLIDLEISLEWLRVHLKMLPQHTAHSNRESA